MIWKTYVLVMRISRDTWFDMNVNLEPIMDTFQKDKGFYAIERWTYKRCDVVGDVLLNKEQITVGGN